MHSVSLILSGLLTLAMVAIIAPNIIALNRGKALRNVAIWLAVFLVLALVYQNVGPGSRHPLFATPASLRDTKPVLKVVDPNANAMPDRPSEPDTPPQPDTGATSHY